MATKDLATTLEKSKKKADKLSFWKKVIIFAAALLAAGLIYFAYANNNSGKKYEFVNVKKQDLQEVVEITGNVEAGATINLSFRQSGQISKINFKTGDKVKKDDIIATLLSKDELLNVNRAKANLASSQANLNQRLAGSTDEQIQIAEASLQQAIAARDQGQVALSNAIKDLALVTKQYQADEQKQQLMVDDAKSKYDYALKNQTNTLNTSSQDIENARNTLKSRLLSSSSQIQQALLDLGLIIINDGSSQLGQDFIRLDVGKITSAQNYYYNVKNSFSSFYTSLKSAVNLTDEELIADANKIKSYDADLLASISLTTDTFNILTPSTTLSQDKINSMKSTLSSDSSTLSNGLAGLNIDLQGLLNVKLGLTSSGDVSASNVDNAKNYYDQQVQALEALKTADKVSINSKQTNIANLQSELKIDEASIASAQANLNQVKAPPRAVDVAALRSAVAAAKVDLDLAQQNYEKTLLRAPIDGILTRKNVEVGEQFTFQINNSEIIPVFEMISNQKYKIDANIAEVDVGKIKVGDKAQIKLDAIPNETFDGTIVSIDPVETKIQDVIFYKAEVVIDSTDERIKPGMTCDVIFVLNEASGALTVPEKALVKENNEEYVRILENGQVKNIKVVTGISNLNGDIEIKEGLTEGQQIILKINNG